MPARHASPEAGFTLMEVLLATLLMTIILGGLATVTAQWLPNWNRGMARVQKLERLATGLERVSRDLAVAEMIPANATTRAPLFDGAELSVTFVRTALGPNARPGLEVVRLIEKADDQGLALVRERAPFVPMAPDAQIKFVDPVVLIRAPFRITFAYAGPDRVWQPTWRDRPLLPDLIRVAVRDGVTGQTLSVSDAVTVHVDMPPDCVRSQNPKACLIARAQPGGAQAEKASE